MAPLAKRLHEFRRQWPVDDAAFQALRDCDKAVIEKVLTDFNPGNADDYSPILQKFTKSVQKRMNAEGHSSGGHWERREVEGHWERRDGKSLDDIVYDVGRKLGRAPRDIKPFLVLLKDNWYDSPESLAGAAKEDLSALGIPMRFVGELMTAIEGSGGSGRSYDRQDRGKGGQKGKSSKDWSDDRRDEGKSGGKRSKGDSKGKSSWDEGGKSGGKRSKGDRSEGKGKKEGKGKREGKGKGRDRDRDRDGGSDRFEHVIDVPVDGIPPEDLVELRGALIGNKGKNMQYISENTGAYVHLSDENQDTSLVIEIKAAEESDVQDATELVNELVETVMEKYQEDGPSKKRRKRED